MDGVIKEKPHKLGFGQFIFQILVEHLVRFLTFVRNDWVVTSTESLFGTTRSRTYWFWVGCIFVIVVRSELQRIIQVQVELSVRFSS